MKKVMCTKKLGEVCEIVNRGISPKYINYNGLNVLNQKCIRNHKIDYDLSRCHDFASKKVNSDKFIQIGDVLVNSTGTGTLGRVAQVKALPFAATVDSHITIVRPKKDIFYNDFFGYALISVEEKISKMGEGCGGQTELARNTIKNNFVISFPESIAEQKRIVEILDKAFAAIDKAKENAEKNLRNAREIFENYLNGISLHDNKGWVEKKLKDIGYTQTGITPKTLHKEYYGKFIPFVKPADINMTGDGVITLNNDGLSEKGYSVARIIQKNSILMVCIGASIGKVGFLEAVASCNQQINALTPSSIYEPKIFYYLLSRTTPIAFSVTGKIWVKNHAHILRFKNITTQRFVEIFFSSIKLDRYITGAAQPKLNQSALNSIIIPTPSLIEQEKIVSSTNMLFKEIKKLEVTYQKQLANLEELKKSILQKAFNGEL